MPKSVDSQADEEDTFEQSMLIHEDETGQASWEEGCVEGAHPGTRHARLPLAEVRRREVREAVVRRAMSLARQRRQRRHHRPRERRHRDRPVRRRSNH